MAQEAGGRRRAGTHDRIPGKRRRQGSEAEAAIPAALDRARDLGFLLRASRELTSSLDLPAVLQRVSRTLLDGVSAWRVGILLIEDAGAQLRLAAGLEREAGGPPRKGLSLDLDRYPEVRQAIQSRRLVAIRDVATDELLEPVRDAVLAAGVGALLVVPLVLQERCLGVVSLAQGPGVPPFTRRDRFLVEAVANQAAVAVRNAQLYGEVRRAAKDLERKVAERTRSLAESHLRLSVLNEITAAINVSLDLDRILEAALRCLQRLKGMDRAQVYLTTAPAGSVRAFGLDQAGRLLQDVVELPGDGDGGEPRVLALDGRPVPLGGEPPPSRSHLLAPLVSKDGVVGALQVFSSSADAHGDADVDLLQQVAGELSIALERSELYEASQRRSTQFEVISDIGRQLTGAVALENLLPTAAELIRSTFGYSTVTVFTLADGGEMLEAAGVSATSGEAERRVLGWRMPADRGLCGRALRTGTAVLANDVTADPDYVTFEGVQTKAELVVPLTVTGETVGLLDVQSSTVGAFTEHDVALVRTLADQLAAALHLSRLFDDVVRQRQHAERIINNLTGGLLVTDRHGVVQDVNFRGAEILHVDRWDLLGRDFLAVVPTAAPLFEVAPDSVSRECEVTLPDGERIPIGFSNAFFVDAEIEAEAIIITFRDLSEIRGLQRKVRHAERLATIGTVAAGVAHEIRNPLFGISATAQIIADELPVDSPLQELVQGMLDETRRLNGLVESLVSYGRPQTLHLVTLDAVRLWEEVLDQSAARLRQAGARVERAFPDGPAAVEADADQLKQVFLNLLLNAVEATPGGSVRIGVHRAEDGQSVVTSVADDGPGLDAAAVDKVFDLFYTTKSGGSGMGLAICSKIVEDHGGTISAAASPSGGALFEVRLPAAGAVEPSSGSAAEG